MESHRSRRPAPAFLQWATILAAIGVLSVATYVTGGASADDAILAVRVAESDLRRAGHSRITERELQRAWSALETHRYEEAINAAQDARQSLKPTD